MTEKTPVNMMEKYSHGARFGFSTVRIETLDRAGLRKTGTGFFFHFEADNTNYPLIITNRHVVEGKTEATFHLTKRANDGSPLFGQQMRFVLQDSEKAWIHHPDSTVDLSALKIADMLREFEEKCPAVYQSYSQKAIPTPEEMNSLNALEQVIMVGYPIGLWDDIHNTPLFRKGIAASHPCLDFRGRKEFVIDIACLPGSSGSPVFLLRDKPGVFRLLRVLSGGPDYPRSTNLGYVIKAEQILEFEPLAKKGGSPMCLMAH